AGGPGQLAVGTPGALQPGTQNPNSPRQASRHGKASVRCSAGYRFKVAANPAVLSDVSVVRRQGPTWRGDRRAWPDRSWPDSCGMSGWCRAADAADLDGGEPEPAREG